MGPDVENHPGQLGMARGLAESVKKNLLGSESVEFVDQGPHSMFRHQPSDTHAGTIADGAIKIAVIGNVYLGDAGTAPRLPAP
jgi:hypothetical protein